MNIKRVTKQVRIGTREHSVLKITSAQQGITMCELLTELINNNLK
jgi:hypothetical protein